MPSITIATCASVAPATVPRPAPVKCPAPDATESDDQAIAFVTVVDLLAGIRVPPSVRFLPPPGVRRLCKWCGRIEQCPDDVPVTWQSDGICLPCLLNVQLLHNARGHRVILLPDRALADPHMPTRWRVYGELQKDGASTTWIVPGIATIAGTLGRQRDSVYRAIRQLETAGYLQRRIRRVAGKRGGVVHEVRLLMGGAAAGSETGMASYQHVQQAPDGGTQ